LSQAGFKIAHIDSNPYYGADEASLSLDELIQWADGNSRPNPDQGSPYMSSQGLRFTSISISRSSSSLPHGRQYCLSLSPSIIPAIGPFISSLISSGVSRYGGFRLLERIALYNRSGGVKHVPFNKEDVFKNKDIGLLDKRRLMRFLMFAAGEFEGKQELVGNEEVPFHKFLQNTFALNENMANAIAYSLAYCVLASGECSPWFMKKSGSCRIIQITHSLLFVVFVDIFVQQVDTGLPHFWLGIMAV
jgi:RAB protein geranylgeranyltransferase component A